MKAICVRSEWIDDWFRVVREEHDGKEWCEEIRPGYTQFMMSERLVPDACIEGTSGEMLSLASAIETHRSVSFKRCAVDATKEVIKIWSPKNSRVPANLDHEEAKQLAKSIRETTQPQEDAQ